MRKLIYILFFVWFGIGAGLSQRFFTISGYITDSDGGETLVGANIYDLNDVQTGASANSYGFYSLSLPEGKHSIRCSYLGFQNKDYEVFLKKDTVINIQLTQGVILKDVVIDAKKQQARKNVIGTQVGTVKLEMKQLKMMPVLMGEVDVLKSIQLLPGVTSVSEGNSGFYVRGGGADQNLILLDEAIVYNTGHMLGFFSVFNADALKSTTLIKGGMPANYGQRLSSVVDIKMKDGNDKYYSIDAGIGLISSRLTAQGPIVKNKSSFIISGRRTYILDLVQPLLKGKKFEGTNYFFYDFNTKLNYKFSDKDRLYLSGYFGRDVFKLNFKARAFEILMPYGNSTATLRWNHLFSNKLFVNTSVIYNDYNYKLGATQEKFSFENYSGVRDYNVKIDFDYFLNNKNKLKFGSNYTYHKLSPNILSAKGEDFNLNNEGSPTYAHESSLYLLDELKVSELLKANIGLRLSAFSQMGNYKSKVDSKMYEPNELVKIYYNIDPRFNLRMITGKNSSLKASLSFTSQYLHLVSNSSGSIPSDIWVSSTEYVKPEKGIQYSLGFFKNLFDDTYETSVEVYYKDMKNQIEFREDYVGSLEDDLENKFVFGKGRAYGLELFFKKSTGKFTGWIGYTLSRTERKFELINNNRWFGTTYDKPHDLSVVLNYKISTRWNAGAVFVYGSGRRYTPVSDIYILDGQFNLEYGDRNSASLPAYHRLDLSIVYKSKKRKNWSSSWSFGVYNVYNRKNPTFINYDTEIDKEAGKSQITASKITIFPIIPSISYNFSWNSK